MIDQLAVCDWIRYGQNCIITGATGLGKSWLACVLAEKACREGYQALYQYALRLFREMLAAEVAGSFTKMVRKLARIDLPVIDDWGLELERNLGRQVDLKDFSRSGMPGVFLSADFCHLRFGELSYADVPMGHMSNYFKLSSQGCDQTLESAYLHVRLGFQFGKRRLLDAHCFSQVFLSQSGFFTDLTKQHFGHHVFGLYFSLGKLFGCHL